ncbi:MAG: mechanosensitive ion channel [Blastocatellia bacterium]|nr:mechanosensitive ion channel [Blastocatellia bacterium]
MDREIEKIIIEFLTKEEGTFGGIGLLTCFLLLILLRLLLPKNRLYTLRFPIISLVIHVVIDVIASVLEKLLGLAELAGKVWYLGLFFLLLSLSRLVFLVIFDIFFAKLGRPIPKITQDIFQGIAYVGVTLLTLRAAGVQLSSLLVTTTLLTAIIGFALQETLGNIVAGLTLQAQQPFEIGDWIQLDGHVPTGEVKEVNWRATKMVTLDKVEVTIPNGMLAKNSILNYSKPSRVVRRNIYIVAPYHIPPRSVSQIILQTLEETPDVLTEPSPSVVTNRFLENGLIEYWVRVFITAFDKRDGIDSRVRDRIWYALERAKLDFPYPTSTINFHQVVADVPAVSRTIERQEVEMHLRAIHFLKPLKDEEISALAKKIEKRLYSPSEVIIKQGDEGDEFFIVHRGKVSVMVSGQEVTRMQAGSYFGEMSLLTGARRSATVIAVGEVELFVLSHTTFREVLTSHTDLTAEMSKTLAQRQMELERVKESVEDLSEKALQDRSTQILQKIKDFFSL